MHVLADYPRSGRKIPERELWESWIPGTRLVAWYDFGDDELIVIAIWHTSRDRS
jgi:plasmid stabilization system protein ParE